MRTPHVTQIEKDPFRPWARVVRRNDGATGRGAADEFKRTERALRPLLTLHAFRFVGLAFLVPGVVGPDLPAAFARPAAYGDLGAAILALLALAVLATSWGLAVVWLFNLWGAVDLLYGFSHGLFGVGLSPGSLGAGFFLITVIVPLLLITHGLTFRLLLQRPLSPTRRG